MYITFSTSSDLVLTDSLESIQRMIQWNGSKLMLLTCALAHFFIITTNAWLQHTLVGYIKLCWNVSQGITYLLYPLFGWIADTRVTHYKMIRLSFVLILLSSILMFANAIFKILNPNFIIEQAVSLQVINIISLVIILTVGIAGFGMYEANAIQFGMNQMLEASSEQLSSFIHWYYWSLHLGPIAIYYTIVPVIAYFQHCKVNFEFSVQVNKQNVKILGWMLLLPSIVQATMMIIGLFIIIKLKNCFYIDTTRQNPFKNVIKVLQYAKNHTFPVCRSAFTYWENDIPSRINLGKHKYGGPFTNEQVEDVKTLLQLLLLIISLFGFQLSGDGYSLSEHMIRYFGCPKMWTLLGIVMNPEHLTIFVILIGIPLYQLFVKKYFARQIPNLLTRMKFGLFICLVREMLYPFSFVLAGTTEKLSSCDLSTLYKFNGDNSSVILMCIVTQAKVITNGTCDLVCPPNEVNDTLFLLFVIPQILHGLSYLLVFMTVLEFICAQAPHTMKGLLIGIWYSTLSIKFLVVNSIDEYMVGITNWNIYHGVKGFGIFLSIGLFSLHCKFYRYRERDEIVNEQAIIEEQYERELLHTTK